MLSIPAPFEKLSNNFQSIPALRCRNGILAQSCSDKATVLSSFFKECFNYSIEPLSFSDLDIFGSGQTHHDCPEEFLCTEDQVQYMLDSLEVTKSTGPDNIPARVLKLVASSIAPSVTVLFNTSIKKQDVSLFYGRSQIL